MEKFLDDNDNILEKMNNLDRDAPGYRIKHTDKDNLGYPPRANNLIGFNVTLTPEYIWNLCAWMAVKADCKNKNGDFFFYYDSQRMVVTFDRENKQNTVVDQNGVRILDKDEDINRRGGREKLHPEMIKFFEEIVENRQELNQLFFQLNDKWNEFNLTYEAPVKSKKIKP